MKKKNLPIVLCFLCMLGCGTQDVRDKDAGNKTGVDTSALSQSVGVEITQISSDENGDLSRDNNMSVNNDEKPEGVQDSKPSGTPDEVDDIGPGKNDGVEAGQAPISNAGGDVITSEPNGGGSSGSVIGVVTNDKPDNVGGNVSSGKSPEEDSIQSTTIKGVENANINKVADVLKMYSMPSFVAETAPDNSGIYTQEWGEYSAEFRTDSDKNIYAGVISAKGSDAIKLMNSISETLNLTDKTLSEEDFSDLEVNQGQYICYLSQRGDIYIMQIGSKSYVDSIKG